MKMESDLNRFRKIVRGKIQKELRKFISNGDLIGRQQQLMDDRTSHLALYQFHACPFCIITRRTMRRLGLNIELRDAQNDPRWEQELIEQGGRRQVPCLRITDEDGKVEWLYESKDIMHYLEQQYGDTA